MVESDCKFIFFIYNRSSMLGRFFYRGPIFCRDSIVGIIFDL